MLAEFFFFIFIIKSPEEGGYVSSFIPISSFPPSFPPLRFAFVVNVSGTWLVLTLMQKIFIFNLFIYSSEKRSPITYQVLAWMASVWPLLREDQLAIYRISVLCFAKLSAALRLLPSAVLCLLWEHVTFPHWDVGWLFQAIGSIPFSCQCAF